MTTEPMDVQDWQQDQINKLSPYDDDRAVEIERRIGDRCREGPAGRWLKTTLDMPSDRSPHGASCSYYA
jgi:hypothetical protein